MILGVRKGFSEAIEGGGPAAHALLCKRGFGFALRKGKSGVRGGGEGLFIEGVAPPGALLGFIPGYCVRPEASRTNKKTGQKEKMRVRIPSGPIRVRVMVRVRVRNDSPIR